eukprot:61771-Prorocentrum_minimum.AAC.1
MGDSAVPTPPCRRHRRRVDSSTAALTPSPPCRRRHDGRLRRADAVAAVLTWCQPPRRMSRRVPRRRPTGEAAAASAISAPCTTVAAVTTPAAEDTAPTHTCERNKSNSVDVKGNSVDVKGNSGDHPRGGGHRAHPHLRKKQGQ